MANQTASDINLISSYLAHDPGITLKQLDPAVIIICGSAILHTSEVTFKYLQHCAEHTPRPKLHTLVIAGGSGHSTSHLYDAVLRHPLYSSHFTHRLEGKAEAVVLDEIRRTFYPVSQPDDVKVIVEDQSTNCGANAECARKVLEQHGVYLEADENVAIVQDPTMSLRTLKCFEKTYADLLPPVVERAKVKFCAFPTFIPVVKVDLALNKGSDESKVFVWDTLAVGMKEIEDVGGLWDMMRFFGLLLGEIPRLRDDENGYGPKGKSFIGHVDVPIEVEEAWKRLATVLDVKR